MAIANYTQLKEKSVHRVTAALIICCFKNYWGKL